LNLGFSYLLFWSRFGLVFILKVNC